jgi:hypothetical protein
MLVEHMSEFALVLLGIPAGLLFITLAVAILFLTVH